MRHATGWIAAAGLAASASGQTATWINPAGGDWLDPANWAGGAAPQFHEGSVRFDLDGAYTVLAPFWFSGRRLVIDRSDLTLLSRSQMSAPNGVFFEESEPINPPAVVVGSLAGASASLTTDLPMGGRVTVVGAAGEASVTTAAPWFVEDLFLGGAMEDASAVGAFTLAGAGASLFNWALEPPNATVGVGGAGRLSLLDGATASLGALRLALEPASLGEVEVSGAGSRLTVRSLLHEQGEASVTISDGAVFAFEEPADLGDLGTLGGRLNFTLDGGSAEGVASTVGLQSLSLTIRGGSRFLIGPHELARMADLRVSGAGSTVAVAEKLWVRGPMFVEDGARVIVGQSSGPSARVTATVNGLATIDGGEFIVDDGVDGPTTFPKNAAIGLAVDTTTPGIRIMHGGRIEVEGAVSLWVSIGSEIRGSGSAFRQRAQAVTAGLPTGSFQDYGGTAVSDGFGSPEANAPTLTVADGAVFDASSLFIGASIAIDASTLIADEGIHLRFGAVQLNSADAIVRTDRLVVGVRFDPPPPPRPVAALRGQGVIEGAVSNSDLVDPDGALIIDGAFDQSAHTVQFPPSASALPSSVPAGRGLLHIDIAAPTTHDALEVTGDALLGGTLRAAFLDGFAPAWGDSFTFLTAGLIDGEFETLELPEAPSGLVFEVEYTDTTATLVAHRRTDLTRDFKVGSADLGLLLGLWGSSDARADLNGDGLVGGADLGLLLGDWGLSAE